MHDVLIIGAGAAGLMAAKELHEAGFDVLLCEASDRIGGRMRTIDRDGQAIELGAEFVHGRPPVTLALLEAAGIEVAEGSDERLRWEAGRLRPAPEFWDVVEKVHGQMDRDRDEPYDDFLARAVATPAEKRLARGFVEGFNAADASVIGTKGLVIEEEGASQIEGDRFFRLPSGYCRLVDWLRKQVPEKALRMETVVREIQWEAGKVRVLADCRGEACVFEAARVVITVPLGVLKAGAIRFEPPLVSKVDALAHLHMGVVIRVVLQFRERFWEKHGRFTFVTADEVEIPVWWTREPERSNILTGWAGGPAAARLAGLSRDILEAKAIASLAEIFGESPETLRALLEHCDFHDWTADPFTRGAYSYPGVGGIEAAQVLAAPVAGTLFFAGEATDSAGANGTVHGALASGPRVAQEIVASSLRP